MNLFKSVTPPWGLDGGYLAWTYGSSFERRLVWSSAFLQYFTDLLVLDSAFFGWRRHYFPFYKSHRAQKARRYPKIAQKTQEVKAFQEVMKESFAGEYIQLPAFEADDILALLWVRGEIEGIVGVDKDFYQLPGVLLKQVGEATGSTFEDRHSWKLPKSCGEVSDPWIVLLNLILMGDKSDGVPRLLPPRNFELYWEIRDSENPFWKGYELLGNAWMQNLLLVLQPPPMLLVEPRTDPLEVLDTVSQGIYWQAERFCQLADLGELRGYDERSAQTSQAVDRCRGTVGRWQDYLDSGT